jgi:hypothetical protein
VAVWLHAGYERSFNFHTTGDKIARKSNYINREQQGVVFQRDRDLKVLWNLLLLTPKLTINLISKE